ncbi:hypothetical protein GCM10009541_55030 [Micromonospora gifhornensis]|uniref:Uncharacterized protein n=1 Tax=Micromonospora gifhornensis TaxID=84594 RepID=A0ABQ4IBR9_9ACTN|nr:hypothetical protein Vgi01_20160 [Micromonospora gifhornensis]
MVTSTRDAAEAGDGAKSTPVTARRDAAARDPSAATVRFTSTSMDYDSAPDRATAGKRGPRTRTGVAMREVLPYGAGVRPPRRANGAIRANPLLRV